MVPTRSLEQRLTALRNGNRIRSARAQAKRDLKAGSTVFEDYLEHPDFDTMKVYDLLLAVPRIGTVKAGVLLRRIAIAPSKTIGGMSRRQRSELIFALRAHRYRRQFERPTREDQAA